MNEREQPVGSLGDEAVKLLKALQDWTQESERGATPSGALHDVAGSHECRYCPLCQLIAAVRATSPEVRHHLGVAASSLMQAAAGLLTTAPTVARDGDPMEHIDLDGEWEDED